MCNYKTFQKNGAQKMNKTILIISLITLCHYMPSSCMFAASSTTRKANIIHSIKDLQNAQQLPKDTTKQKKLFVWLLDTLNLQDQFVNNHYESMLFDKKRHDLQRDLELLFPHFTKPVIDKNGAQRTALNSPNQNDIKMWQRYQTIMLNRKFDKTDIDAFQAIIDKNKERQSTKTKVMIAYLKKVVELEKLNLYRLKHNVPKVTKNLNAFRQLTNTDYKDYLYLNTFYPMAEIFIGMQKWLNICQERIHKETLPENLQKEDVTLHITISTCYKKYQNIRAKLNQFKNELQRSINPFMAQALKKAPKPINGLEFRRPKRNPKNYLNRSGGSLGEKYQKRSENPELRDFRNL